MSTARPLRVALLMLAAASLLAAPAAAAADGAAALPARAMATAPPEVRLIAQDGFGDAANNYAWSMARFRGRVYVGTGRLVACVENATVDFFLRVSGRYVIEPFPDTECPADPYDMDLRAEIWEYTLRTGRWRLAYRSPADIPNPRAPGKFVARDISFRGMAVFRDGQGRKRLYIGGVTADEYIPELKRAHPPRLLSTLDGRRFHATPARNVLIRAPYGVFRPMGIRTLRIWNGRMYATLTPSLTGDGPIFEVKRPWSPRRVRFKQVTPDDITVFETDIFAGALYAGTGDRERGYGVYRITRNGGKHRVRPVLTGGAGRGQIATSVVSMHAYKGRLYVGSSGWYNRENNPISELIRIDRRGRWQVVAGPPRVVRGVLKAPISGMGDGFNNIFTGHFWRMATYRGALVVGTNDWSYLLSVAYPGLDQWVVDLLDLVIEYDGGFDLWATCNGHDWGPITRDGFGGHPYDFGARNLVTAGSQLMVGTANHADGTKIWGYRDPGCRATDAPVPAPVSPPQKLLADAQSGGTVVSWRAAAAHPPGTRYRVLRARYRELPPLDFTPPPVQANGFPLEGALPTAAAPAPDDGMRSGGAVLTRFTTVGRTAGAMHFVDRTRAPGTRYAYRVVAETPRGARSAPSAVQVVPDLRPPPTLGQVRRSSPALRSDPALAVASHSRGHTDATLRALGRVRRSAPPGSDLRLLVDRLERRLRYEGLAAGRRGG